MVKVSWKKKLDWTTDDEILFVREMGIERGKNRLELLNKYKKAIRLRRDFRKSGINWFKVNRFINEMIYNEIHGIEVNS